MEVVMRAVISGLSTVMLFLGAVFWLGDEWRWLMDFLLQLFLFCLLGKFILVPAFFLATAFRSARILCFGIALMISVFIRWIAILIFDFRVDKVFPVVECWHGIPYTILCAWLVYLALSRTSFMGWGCGRLSELERKKSGIPSMALTFCAQSTCS